MTIQTVSIDFHGKTYSLESGRFAKFANGSVMVRCGDTMTLVTVVASEEVKPDTDFLPLQVEYREKTASSGKFPGGFLKREGRPSEREILCSRLIDRPIRPLIPKSWHYETQIIATVFSAEPDVDSDTLAAIGASAALMISDIPFAGPISEVKVGRINGEFIANPSFEQLKSSDIDMTVAGTDSSIVMVEGESKEISEDEFVAALQFAHENIKILNGLQKQLFDLFEVKKREYEQESIPLEFEAFIAETVAVDLHNYIHSVTSKEERKNLRTEIYNKALESVQLQFAENEAYSEFNFEKSTAEVINELEKNQMRKMILDEGKRLDGRSLTDIRNIACEIDLLPRVHGSALFTRGETQSLSTATLGTKQDEQMVDGLLPVYFNRFMLHYNFPPYCTGEVGRLTGTGRREIGHGNLAERALKAMLPPQADFPYTIRVVSDILESNGSSSMATVCAGSLALFSAGIPMKKPVAGIAMGLIMEDENYAILSDILGDEDHLGDMDFKVAGTEDGITACQMDIKIEGVSVQIMQTALEQARKGRLHILSIMNSVISEPKPELSPYAPRFTTMHIPVDMIGAVIGPGGEMIRSICSETGTVINIEDDGTILISSTSHEASLAAVDMIDKVIRKPEEGEVYDAKVVEIKEGMGAILEFLPKKQGLLHISQISYERTENVSDVLKVGDKLKIKLLEITNEGKYRLSRKALLPKPEGYEEKPYNPSPRNRDQRGPRPDRGRPPYSRDRR